MGLALVQHRRHVIKDSNVFCSLVRSLACQSSSSSMLSTTSTTLLGCVFMMPTVICLSFLLISLVSLFFHPAIRRWQQLHFLTISESTKKRLLAHLSQMSCYLPVLFVWGIKCLQQQLLLRSMLTVKSFRYFSISSLWLGKSTYPPIQLFQWWNTFHIRSFHGSSV